MMKIAFASSDGSLVDRHFGLTETFYLWDVNMQHAQCVGKIDLSADSDEKEDKITARAVALEGCTLVYSLQIGGPAAAKLVARHIHPLKTTNPVHIAELVDRLKTTLQGRPPPWLCKAMGIKPTVLRSTTVNAEASTLTQRSSNIEPDQA